MSYLGFLIALTCLLFAGHLALNRRRNSTLPTMLCLLFLVFALQSGMLAAALVGITPAAAHFVRPTLAMTIGPLLYLAMRSGCSPPFTKRKSAWPHFVPALFVALQMILDRFWIDVDFAVAMSFFSYSAILWWRVSLGANQFDLPMKHRTSAQKSLVVAALLLSIFGISEVVIANDIAMGTSRSDSSPLLTVLFADLVVIFLVIFLALQRPSPLEWIYLTGRSERSPVEHAHVAKQFEKLIEQSRLFLDPGTTIHSVARELGLSERQLSESINHYYGEGFARRVNRRRVDEAKRLLCLQPHKQVTEIMFDAGFGTKSSFNKEFRALTGVSPSQFRKQHTS